MTAYYNEFEPFAADWLRNLIAAGLIAPGDVDQRSIEEVAADDLRGYTQVHLFAGIGGWSYAARLAGWPDDRPLWTGSCPCQPFSEAGQRLGESDPRDLWPVMFRLVRECRPDVVAGEQVASAVRRGWSDRLSANLEAAGYAVGTVVLGAHSIGAPHIRPRLFWLADADDSRWQGAEWAGESGATGPQRSVARRESLRPTGGYWPPGPGAVASIPAAPHGVPSIMGRCRAYGNAIVPQVAAAFLMAYIEADSFVGSAPGEGA